MGGSILDQVLQELRNAGFTAEVAYPGQKYPPITDTVAAVHIEEVDRANMNVTVEVTVISPAALGGTACEIQALKATEVLRWAGANCVQKGCDYDGMAQVYCVNILATFTCITEAETCTMGPGFTVYVGGRKLVFLTEFFAEESWEGECCYEIGESYPTAVCFGKHHWDIHIQELIPAGSEELQYPINITEIIVEMQNGVKEIYRNCLFTSMKRENTNSGLKRTLNGIALRKTVVISG